MFSHMQRVVLQPSVDDVGVVDDDGVDVGVVGDDGVHDGVVVEDVRDDGVMRMAS